MASWQTGSIGETAKINMLGRRRVESVESGATKEAGHAGG